MEDAGLQIQARCVTAEVPAPRMSKQRGEGLPIRLVGLVPAGHTGGVLGQAAVLGGTGWDVPRNEVVSQAWNPGDKPSEEHSFNVRMCEVGEKVLG